MKEKLYWQCNHYIGPKSNLTVYSLIKVTLNQELKKYKSQLTNNAFINLNSN